MGFFMFKLCYLSICVQNDKEQPFCNKNIFKTDTLEIKLSRRWNTNNKQQWTDSVSKECHLCMCEGWRGDPDIQKKKQQKSIYKEKKTVQA